MCVAAASACHHGLRVLSRFRPAPRFVAALVLSWSLPGLAVPALLRAQSGRQHKTTPATPAPAGTQTRPKRTAAPQPSTPARLPGQPAMPDEATATNDGITPSSAVTNGDKIPKRATTVEAETTDDEIVRVTSNLVPVTAIVQDEQGKVITDLELKDFELSVDGQPKPIGELSRSETPVRLALLFDNSKSVRGTREFEKQAAVRFFRSVMRPVDLAAIYSVQTGFDLEQPLTGDVPRLVRTIERFGEPEGATRLLDAIAAAADYLRPQRGRKVIVIVSDGTDTISDASFDDTLRRVIVDDCQVYTVQTGVAENANLYDLMAVRRMESLATQTGGAVYVPKSYAELDSAFAQISADLAHQYVLSYYANDDRRDSRFRVISVRVANRSKLRVRARRGYYPRKPPEPPTTSGVSASSDKAQRAYLPGASRAQ